MTMVPQPPPGSRAEAAPSPARAGVAPLDVRSATGGFVTTIDGTRSVRSASPDAEASPRVSRLVGEKAKWSKLPGLMRKMKVVNQMKDGSKVVGANVEWQNAADQADRLQSRIQGLREKSAGMGMKGIDPRLMEEVFARADELVDLAPMKSKKHHKKETAKEKEAKEKEEAKARLVPTDLPLNMAPATYSQLPKRVQRRLAREYASRDKTADEKSVGQRVAAEAQRKAAHANVIEPQVGVIPSTLGDDSTASVMECLLPLMELSQSKFTATLRDLAAALHSLAFNDENRMAFFVTPGAMEMLYRLAHSPDYDVQRNITGTLYRLSMGEVPGMKRTMVQGSKHHVGMVQPLLELARASERGTRQNAMGALKELCECPANRSDMLDQGMLQLVFEQLSSPDYVDIRVRRDAVYSLSAMAEDPSNRGKMVDMGCLPRLLGILRNPRIRDSQMRRAASGTLERLAMTRSHKVMGLMTSKWVLMTFIAALSENSDYEVIQNALRTLQILGAWSARSKRLVVKHGAFDTLFRMAQSMLKDEEANGDALLLFQEVVSTIGKLARGRDNLEHIFTIGHSVRTTLQLCKFADRKVRRGGATLLTRLSTLEGSKVRLLKDGAVPLLISMAKLRDNFIQFTAAQCLAELAEEPRNRKELLRQGVLPTFTSLARSGDPQTAFECARGMADLSEACDNRTLIVYTAIRDILDMLRGDEDDVQENAARCLCNLIAPAGEVATAAYGEAAVTAIGRYGALKDDDDDSESDDEEESEESEYETVDEDEESVEEEEDEDSDDSDASSVVSKDMEEEPPDWFLGKVEMPSLEDTDPETVGAVQLIQDQWRTVQARRMREIRRRMKMASKIQGMWRLNKQKESQAKEEEEARLAKEEAEAEWADVILARAELKEAEASGNKKRIAKAMTDLARETREAEEAQENAEREMREAEEAKAAAVAAEARAAEARAAEEAALARGKPRRPRPVTPPRKPGQKVLSAKTRRAISGRPAKKMSSSRSRPLSSSPIAERESEAGSRPPDDIPEDILREQKLQGKKTFSASMFGANGGAEAKEKLEEEENQPDWWQSQAGEEKKIDYNSEDGELARIHVRVWDEKAYIVLKAAMRDNDPEVRHYATEALKYLENYSFTPMKA